jgi:hypothetical protein
LGAGAKTMQLTWLDRTGKKLDTVGEPGEIANPVLSPDGKRVLVTIRDPATKTRDIWIMDLARVTTSRFDPAEDYNPIWSPEGVYVVFSSSRKGKKDIYRKRADGVGGEEELFAKGADKGVDSISPDGKYVLYNEIVPAKPISIWVLPLTGERKPVRFAGEPFYANLWPVFAQRPLDRLHVQRIGPAPGVRAERAGIGHAPGEMAGFQRGRFDAAMAPRRQGAVFSGGRQADGHAGEDRRHVVRIRYSCRLIRHPPGCSCAITSRPALTASADGQRFLFAWPKDSDNAGQVHVMLNWPALLKRP